MLYRHPLEFPGHEKNQAESLRQSLINGNPFSLSNEPSSLKL